MDTPAAPQGATPLARSFASRWGERLSQAVMAPVRAFRIAYVPLLMVYFAYGALGLFAVADSFWVKQDLSLTPQALAQLGVWLTLPWAMKMVFGELVDTVAIAGSRAQRRVYVFLGATMIAAGLILLAGGCGQVDRICAARDALHRRAVADRARRRLQDVVADAMSTEVVPRFFADGTARPKPTSNAISGSCRSWGGSRSRSGRSSSRGSAATSPR